MAALKQLFKLYWRDTGGAFAIMFVMIFGFLFMALNVGITAMKIQNPATSADQLIDIACQKISTADPALYPTADAVIVAAMSALNARRVRGLSNNEGVFNITASDPDPRYNSPIQIDGSNADLRRFEFTVSYTGKAYGLNQKLVPAGTADINRSKKCRPVCLGMTNIIYSNAIAVGHWLDKNRWKFAQEINANGTVNDNFDDVPFADGFQNPGQENDRYVLTIMDADAQMVRYRTIVKLPDQFYIDNDAIRTPGEPRARGLRRIVAGDEDQIFIQSLNADGSLPGICGEPLEKPCVGANCCIGDGCKICTGPDCSPVPFVCPFTDVMPVKAKFRDLRNVRLAGKSVEFQKDNLDRPSKLVIQLPSGRILRVRLAPFYVANTEMVTVKFKDGTATMPSQEASAIALTDAGTARARILAMPGHKYLVHMAGVHWYWFWDGDEKCTKFRSPIVFDTQGIGQILTTKNANQQKTDGPFFDYFGNGDRVQVEWPIGKGQAWLVDNRDGRAAEDMNGRRFFGDLDDHEDGYEKLRELDTSGTGVLTGADLEGLVLWFDNGNAIVDPGELKSLAEVGITSVDTRAEWVEFGGDRQALRSHAIMNGRKIMTEDIFVAITSKAVPAVNANLNDVK